MVGKPEQVCEIPGRYQSAGQVDGTSMDGFRACEAEADNNQTQKHRPPAPRTDEVLWIGRHPLTGMVVMPGCKVHRVHDVVRQREADGDSEDQKEAFGHMEISPGTSGVYSVDMSMGDFTGRGIGTP